LWSCDVGLQYSYERKKGLFAVVAGRCAVLGPGHFNHSESFSLPKLESSKAVQNEASLFGCVRSNTLLLAGTKCSEVLELKLAKL
jgi:hypothetical protein